MAGWGRGRNEEEGEVVKNGVNRERGGVVKWFLGH